jgi:hypothetical protein
MKNIRGPMTIIVNVDLGLKSNLSDIKLTPEEQIIRLTDLLNNEDVGTSLYKIPINTPILNIENVKELDIGGIN